MSADVTDIDVRQVAEIEQIDVAAVAEEIGDHIAAEDLAEIDDANVTDAGVAKPYIRKTDPGGRGWSLHVEDIDHKFLIAEPVEVDNRVRAVAEEVDEDGILTAIQEIDIDLVIGAAEVDEIALPETEQGVIVADGIAEDVEDYVAVVVVSEIDDDIVGIAAAVEIERGVRVAGTEIEQIAEAVGRTAGIGAAVEIDAGRRAVAVAVEINGAAGVVAEIDVDGRLTC